MQVQTMQRSSISSSDETLRNVAMIKLFTSITDSSSLKRIVEMTVAEADEKDLEEHVKTDLLRYEVSIDS